MARKKPLNPEARAAEEAVKKLHLAELTFPGPLIRPVPSFTMGVPQGWLVRDCPGAIFAMGTADDDDGPWSNVIVRHERVMAVATLEDVAAADLVRLENDYPGVEVLEASAVEFRNTVQYVRTSKLRMAGWDGLVNRNDSFLFGPPPPGPVADVFHFIWMNDWEATGPWAEIYAAMMATLEFTDPPPAG